MKLTFNLWLFVVSSLFATVASANEQIQYSSDTYLQQQYQMLKVSFLDLEVTKQTDQVVKIVIPTAYGFRSGGAQLNRMMKDKLKKLAHFLNSYPETTIEVAGHTDNVGSPASNIQLGEKRATAVANVLLDNKVHPFRVRAYSEGEEVPKCNNNNVQGRACNRRVELLIALERNLAF
ncbi:OmpA family protein [Vibrio sp.]|uniref:OmpA family protein n=1 Tax=Vibrio sp. TaxID=678 RepID=UPI003D132947